MLKRCSVCKKLKDPEDPEDGFNRNKARKDGFQTHCRSCSHRKFRRYYEKNIEEHRKTCTAIHKRHAGENKQRILEYLLSHPCVDCGETDPVVLEFDHVRGVKSSNVVKLAHGGYSWSRIEKEIGKCEIRCANCHRRRTFGSSSYKTGS